MGEAKVLFRGEHIFEIGLVRGAMAQPPRSQENFRKFSKNFLKKLRKMYYFSIFFRTFKKSCVNFSRLWTKNAIIWAVLEDF